MIFYIKDGKHVFTLSGLNESQSFDNFKAGIEWAYVKARITNRTISR